MLRRMEQVLLFSIDTATLSLEAYSEKPFMLSGDTGLQGSFLPVRVEQRTQDGGPLLQLELEKHFLFTWNYH